MEQALAALGRMAAGVVEGAKVVPGDQIAGRANTTGCVLRLPGATREFYPAFWVRDAAMMLGADLVEADEVSGWVRLIARVQAGPDGLRLAHGLTVPPGSIPDHVTLDGAACWYPGAMDGDDQGDGTFGFLPPADDAFYFVQMIREHYRLTGSPALFLEREDACLRAFGSVAADPETGLVACEEGEGRTRVDWGFCDTVRKTGLCLMPSLLRWRAAGDLAELLESCGRDAAPFLHEAARIAAAIPAVFFQPYGDGGVLLSATGLGRKADLWVSAYAVWLGLLPDEIEASVARGLLALYRSGGAVREGQVRHLPPDGLLGGFWEQCVAAPGTYQNGAFWGAPSGWMAYAIARADPPAGEQLVSEYVAHIEREASRGAPWECANPALDHYQNPRYVASAALPYAALVSPPITRR